MCDFSMHVQIEKNKDRGESIEQNYGTGGEGAVHSGGGLGSGQRRHHQKRKKKEMSPFKYVWFWVKSRKDKK